MNDALIDCTPWLVALCTMTTVHTVCYACVY